jgi:pimeloyl-ACP methyl ester carboxylesterase
VIFLHGYGGSFTLECWLVARATRTIAAVTVCPAVEFSGHWSGHSGATTVRETLDYLRSRGVERIYLAGLSNGAIGASGLAPRFASSLKGLILISGAPSTGGSGGLPALVVQGNHDTMASAATARAFAARTHATYAGFEGGHFVAMTRREEVRAAIGGWLQTRESLR